MITKRPTKNRIISAVFGCLFAMISMFGVWSAVPAQTVYAEEGAPETVEVQEGDNAEETAEAEEAAAPEPASTAATGDASCKGSLGALGWLVCPATGAIAKAVDWLYEKIENILVINPVEVRDGSPIYEIWKYMKGITNIVFIIFLLVVVYSQLTGMGINNYGIKKALPKLIIAAVLMNLSFLICSLAVDLSNIVGNSLRGIFEAVEQNAITMGGEGASWQSVSEMYSAMAGGTALAVGAGVIAFESGAIWMLIPTVLGAIVAVVTGLITIAMRQAVVALLIMAAPLAMVAYILPNTEQWFKKWKQLLLRMLVFYPMFSLLFGASQLAGYAIMASSDNGFGLMLGVAVQIFPLFFSWSLMKMSGTVLGNINARLNGLVARPLAANRAWADSHRMHSRMKYLASGNAYTPSLRLAQFLSKRRTAREVQTARYAETVKNMGLAYDANSHYKNDGTVSALGERMYEMQARNMQYQKIMERNKNNLNKGLGVVAGLTGDERQRQRLAQLDDMNVKASDNLHVERARGETIDYENAKGFHKRMEDAVNAHMDETYGYNRTIGSDGTVQANKRPDYKFHYTDSAGDASRREAASQRYREALDAMEGNVRNVQYAAATAAYGYDTQNKIYTSRLQKYFELTPPTRDVEYRLGEFTTDRSAVENIDSVIPGLRILNQRGDTDLVREQLENILNQGVDLGTHASQALASFLMFEVKDNDPFLRRYGKYINLETAQVYNKNKRKNAHLTLKEYVAGEYEEADPETGEIVVRHPKRDMAVLLEGTSLDNIERTAMKNLDDMLTGAYKDDSGKLDVRKYLARREQIETAFGPQFISASLKYLSGSEQLKSAVSFLTGYGLDGVARWEGDGDLAGDAEFAKNYFRKRTMQYLKDQTPNQVLGMRSDYRDAMIEHLLDAYLNDETMASADVLDKRREEYEKIKSEIQTRYADEDLETAEKKREKDLKEAKMELAGNQMRSILGDSGKLEQIYRTRRSGAANGAKDWVRKMTLLDDEDALYGEVKMYKEKRRQKHKEEMLARGENPGDSRSEKIDDYLNELSSIWNDDTRSEEKSEFYKMMRKKLRGWLGNDSFIEKEFVYYYNEGDPNATNADLYEYLRGLLEDPDNYV